MATFPNVAARMHMRALPGLPGACWCVILAADPGRATPEAFAALGECSAVLTHDPGLTWPDARGVAIARAVMEGGGPVALGFATLADALACKARLDREAGR